MAEYLAVYTKFISFNPSNNFQQRRGFVRGWGGDQVNSFLSAKHCAKHFIELALWGHRSKSTRLKLFFYASSKLVTVFPIRYPSYVETGEPFGPPILVFLPFHP